MSLNSSIIQQIWSGSIPVLIHYNNTFHPFILYRQNYLYTYNHIITQYCDVDSVTYNCTYTIQYNNQCITLPTTLPIGVLYDMYYTNHTTPIHTNNNNGIIVPFTINVEFTSNIQHNQLIELRGSIINNIKQSIFHQYKYCKLNNILNQGEIKELWQAIYDCHYIKYNDIVAKLLLSHTHNQDSAHHLPIRFILYNLQQNDIFQHTYLQYAIPSYTIDELANEKYITTLYTVLMKYFSFIFDQQHNTPNNQSYQLYSNIIILIQGIEVPLATPLNWLCQHMVSSDQWLYIVIKRTL